MTRLILDLLPLAAFFVAYKFYGLMVAVAAIMVVTVVVLVACKLTGRPTNKVHVYSAVLILVFGGLTLAIDNPLFIKIKPTVLFFGMAAVLGGMTLAGKRPMAVIYAGAFPHMPDAAWRAAAWQCAAFLALLGVMNLAFAFMFSEEAWVNFKVFAITPLCMVFFICQAILIGIRHGHGDARQE